MRLPSLVEHDLAFGQVEVQCAALEAVLAQTIGEVEHGLQRCSALLRGRLMRAMLRQTERASHPIIGKLSVRAHDAFEDSV